MVKATIRASIDQDIQKIWQIVTNLQDYSWRSDLSKIEVINERQFIEYTKSGYPTTFTIIDKEPFTLYSFYDGKHKYARALAKENSPNQVLRQI